MLHVTVMKLSSIDVIQLIKDRFSHCEQNMMQSIYFSQYIHQLILSIQIYMIIKSTLIGSYDLILPDILLDMYMPFHSNFIYSMLALN